MSKALIRISILFQLMSNIGILAGVRLTFQILLGRETFPVTVPGYPHPIYLRKGTTDAAILHAVLIDGEYANRDYTAEPKVIVDAGGNIGLASLFFARSFPDAKILAIEPDRENFELMEKNLAPYSNIELFHGALWPNEASLEISNTDEAADSFTLKEVHGDENATIPAITMSQIMARVGGRIDLLKIDIEGAEYPLFTSSNLEWIDAVGAIYIELHDFITPGASKAFYTALAKMDYNQFTNAKPVYIVLD